MSIGSFLKLERDKYKALLPWSKKALQIPTNSLTLPQITFIDKVTPTWRDLSQLIYLLKAYCENFVAQATINVKAEAFANIKFSVKDLKTGEITPIDEYFDDGGKLRALLAQPNPLQASYEWLRQFKVNHEVFGNGYAYASVPSGFEDKFTYQDINVINNLPPYCITPLLTGQWLEATTKDEIIKQYNFRWLNNRHKVLPTNQVLHTNTVNIKFDVHFTEGTSRLVALKKPITNIDKAYESRNVLIEKRGAIGAWTSEKKDDVVGSIPLSDAELKDVQKAFAKYGLLDDQFTQIISPLPLKWQKTTMSVKDLMLFEEVSTSAIAVANAFGVPESLVRYYIKTGTLGSENDKDQKRLYDSTIIPESKDFMISLNNFLKTSELGIELLGSFDHLNVLQINKKEAAETTKLKEAAFVSSFKIGAIVYNDYLAAIGLPQDDVIGELRVWDLDDKQLNAIGIMINTNNNGNSQTE